MGLFQQPRQDAEKLASSPTSPIRNLVGVTDEENCHPSQTVRTLLLSPLTL